MFNVICPGICQLIKCNNGPNVCDQRKERSAILTWIEFHSSLSNWMAEQGLGERRIRQHLTRATKEIVKSHDHQCPEGTWHTEEE